VVVVVVVAVTGRAVLGGCWLVGRWLGRWLGRCCGVGMDGFEDVVVAFTWEFTGLLVAWRRFDVLIVSAA
jgi:hypothetical protein